RSRNYPASYSFLFSLTEIEVILIKSVQSYQTESVELRLAVTVIEKTVKNMLNMERLLYMNKKHIFVTLEERLDLEDEITICILSDKSKEHTSELQSRVDVVC